MKARTFSYLLQSQFIVLAVALAGCASTPPPVNTASATIESTCDREAIDNQFILTFRTQAIAKKAQNLFSTFNLRRPRFEPGEAATLDEAETPLVPISPYSLFLKAPEEVVSEFIAWLAENDIRREEVAEEKNANIRMFAVPPTDPFYPDDQCALVVMNAEDAWTKLEADGRDASNVYVSIVDSGINDAHPDLKDAVKVKEDDVLWHGTHLAGLIGARDDGVGMAGVAWKVNLRSYQFLDANGNGTVDGAIKAVSKALSESTDPDIMLLAWGTGCNSRGLEKLIENKPHVLFVAAAGNNGRDIDKAPIYPAAYDRPNILTVMATTCDDDRVALFSASGAKSVDIAVPGAGYSYSYTPGIKSTVLYDRYGVAQGTSMAAAYAAGGAALVKALHPTWKAAELKKCLMSAVVPLTGSTGNLLKGKCVSEGRLDLAKAANCP
ncbi:MAG TPA: S8 family serine peptidase [Thermoanaerobaculia bacterium]|jgi:subtilisin family serine protease|nr:S8 family serine peptidase [Thermoanaerobaculia bacterium]